MTHGPSPLSRAGQKGQAATELLIAFALLLLFALGIAQVALVFEARAMLSLAIQDAARAGSVGGGRTAVIEAALAQTIAPLYFPAISIAGRDAVIERSRQYLQRGQQEGWVAWRRISPTDASFTDWGEQARNDNGEALGTGLQIGIDNLAHRIRHQSPRGGTAGYAGDEPIGAASGQTLSQATLLKLELRYGVPLAVPLVGQFFAWIMRGYHGCAAAGDKQLGALTLRAQPGTPRALQCPFYQGSDPFGRPVPRWPVQVAATARLQSALSAP